MNLLAYTRPLWTAHQRYSVWSTSHVGILRSRDSELETSACSRYYVNSRYEVLTLERKTDCILGSLCSSIVFFQLRTDTPQGVEHILHLVPLRNCSGSRRSIAKSLLLSGFSQPFECLRQYACLRRRDVAAGRCSAREASYSIGTWLSVGHAWVSILRTSRARLLVHHDERVGR